MTHYQAHNRIYNIKADSLDTATVNIDKQCTFSSKTANTITIKHGNTNSLSGLLAHYDSDSEQEDINCQKPNKLDAKVDDFLQEINKIIPNESSQSNTKKQAKQVCAWQECFDESTGYPYYWNVETNVVTWEIPTEYKNWLSQSVVSELQQHTKIIPVEMNKLNDTSIKPPNTDELIVQINKVHKSEKKKTRKLSSDSEEEKIVMITSFSEGSSSESDSEIKEPMQDEAITKIEKSTVMGPHIENIPKDIEVLNKKEIIENVKENIDETVILARLRTQAKVLHELGGELPKSIDKSVIADLSDTPKPQSLALVAGYGDDSEPEEEPSTKAIFPISTLTNSEIVNEQSQSTLFPLTKPIDVKQFETLNNNSQNYTAKDTSATLFVVDNKIFKRKKRLGVAFDVPKIEKKSKICSTLLDVELEGEERKGFGFQAETNISDNENRTCDRTSFIKSGIAFVKADVLNPIYSEDKLEISAKDNEEQSDDFEEMRTVVTAKVNFLGEGKDPVSAVQTMAIQLQTLELAYKTGGLTQKYLYSWLRDTFVDLENLEQDAAPEGWQCQWDRSNKRYFYRNVSTGEWQWEFPADIIGGGDAMDICTTPPPNEEEDNTSESQPSPPKRSPTPPPPPPPPPIITHLNTTNKQLDNIQPPVPTVPPPVEVTPPPPPTISVSETQPLPPGVDSPDLPFYVSKLKENELSISIKDSLGSELDSFYSDIALLEATTTSGSGTETTKSDSENVPSPSSTIENANNDTIFKKKKKTKSKLGQGINMKKKAVSTLVEKWKKVQNDYL